MVSLRQQNAIVDIDTPIIDSLIQFISILQLILCLSAIFDFFVIEKLSLIEFTFLYFAQITIRDFQNTVLNS